MAPAWDDPVSRGGGVAFAVPPLRGVVRCLVIANVALFLVQVVLLAGTRFQGVLDPLKLQPAAWRAHFPWLPLWQLASYGFLHDGVGHILGNMLFLYFIGTMLEDELGPRRFALFYGAALLLAGAARLALSLALGDSLPIMGASGGVLACVCAVATLRPQTRMIFIIVPLTLRTVALLYVAMDFLNVIQGLKGQGTNVASFAHLAGALFGFLAVRRAWIWRDPVRELGHWRERLRSEQAASDEERLDQLLEKISREGIHSLSAREKAFLKRASQRR
jgi:membrane associated rhomboid family serine protease